nr:ABC transporter G family member 11 [Ipomoea batatas]
MEPYVPHRFSRQFGFYQASSPGLLLTDDRDITLVEGFRLHRQYEHFNSLSRATFPMNPTIPKKHVSVNYKAWLVDVHENLLENLVKDIVINGDPNGSTGLHVSNDARSSNQHKVGVSQEHSDSSESLN